MSDPSRGNEIEPVYLDLLERIKGEVRASRVRAARAVNADVICLYWQIGRHILDRQTDEGWGASVISRLADDLRTEFPEMRGFSSRNLRYMRRFAMDFPAPNVQHPAALLPWGHVMVLLDRIDDQETRHWYAAQAVQHGWSRPTLTHHILTHRHARVGAAPNTFLSTLSPSESDLVREVVQDPYALDFLALSTGFTERELEDALVNRLTHFVSSAPDSPSSAASTR